MNKRSFPILFFGSALFILGILGFLWPDTAGSVPHRILSENSGGRVIFTHNAHSSNESYMPTDCSVCHHEMNMPEYAEAQKLLPANYPVTKESPYIISCAACHRKLDKEEFIEKHQADYMAISDESCAACHHAAFDGLVSSWKHEEHQELTGGDCTVCHHPLNFEYAEGKILDVARQKCSNCHSANPQEPVTTTLEAATHERCGESCHFDWIEDALKGCKSCHNIVPTAGLSAALALTPSCESCHKAILPSMDAYHAQCMTCHDTMDKGPGTEASCAQCHRP